MSDNRDPLTHLIHGIGHLINSGIKSCGGDGIETSDIYKSHSPEKSSKGPWPKEVDDQRAGYHLSKFNDAMDRWMDAGII